MSPSELVDAARCELAIGQTSKQCLKQVLSSASGSDQEKLDCFKESIDHVLATNSAVLSHTSLAGRIAFLASLAAGIISFIFSSCV